MNLGLAGWQMKLELQDTDVDVNFYEDGSFDLNASEGAESFSVKVTDEHGESVTCVIRVNGGTETGGTETGGAETGGAAADSPTLSLEGPVGSYLGCNVNSVDLGLRGWQLKFELLETDVNVNLYEDGSFDLSSDGTAGTFEVEVTDEYGESVVVVVVVSINGGSTGETGTGRFDQ